MEVGAAYSSTTVFRRNKTIEFQGLQQHHGRRPLRFDARLQSDFETHVLQTIRWPCNAISGLRESTSMKRVLCFLPRSVDCIRSPPGWLQSSDRTFSAAEHASEISCQAEASRCGGVSNSLMFHDDEKRYQCTHQCQMPKSRGPTNLSNVSKPCQPSFWLMRRSTPSYACRQTGIETALSKLCYCPFPVSFHLTSLTYPFASRASDYRLPLCIEQRVHLIT